MTAFGDEPGDGVLARAAALLAALDDEHRELTLAALVGRSGLPRSTAHRMAFLGALAARHALRAAAPARRGGATAEEGEARRAAARTALRTLLARTSPPFGEPPATSIDPSTVGR